MADSIQTLFHAEVPSGPGSVAQVRECASALVSFAKQTGCTVLLIGHVTKEGGIAGPKVLEHLVDTVLYFEGDHSSRFRLIRAFKNRYGTVNEMGVFAMTEDGLREVSNPSSMFLSQDREAAPGSVVFALQEATRPLLVEVQALVDNSSVGHPRRVCVGFDPQRLGMLLAVLHRHLEVPVVERDVFVNVAGGIRLSETAADLAVTTAFMPVHLIGLFQPTRCVLEKWVCQERFVRSHGGSRGSTRRPVLALFVLLYQPETQLRISRLALRRFQSLHWLSWLTGWKRGVR